jgi:hypothetical protein
MFGGRSPANDESQTDAKCLTEVQPNSLSLPPNSFALAPKTSTLSSCAETKAGRNMIELEHQPAVDVGDFKYPRSYDGLCSKPREAPPTFS